MTMQIMLVLGILFMMVVAFLTEAIPLAFTAMAVPFLFQLTGILTASEAWAGFSNTTIITWIGLFIIGAMFAKTSITYQVRRMVWKFGNGSGIRVLLICMIFVTALAVLTTSTSALVVLAPLIDEICDETGMDKKKVAKPIADVAMWASIQHFPFGSTFTYLAMFNTYIEQAGGTDYFGLLDFSLIKFPLLIVLVIYYVITCRKLSTSKKVAASENSFENDNKPRTSYTPFQEKCATAIFVLNVIGMVVVAITGIIPAYLVSTFFAILAVALRLLSEKEALNSISWSLVFLVAGTLPISTAMNKTGTGAWIATLVENAFPVATNPVVLGTVFCVISCVITHFMSNTAVWATFGPVAAAMGVTLGIDPRLLLAGVASGAIICYSTPMANPGQAFIYQRYGFTMKEYFMKGAIPCILQILAFALWAPLALNMLYG